MKSNLSDPLFPKFNVEKWTHLELLFWHLGRFRTLRSSLGIPHCPTGPGSLDVTQCRSLNGITPEPRRAYRQTEPHKNVRTVFFGS